MWHPKMIEFDERMNELFNNVDSHIEDLYGSRYALHPVRPERGRTTDPQADGLFNIGANFTPGFGSKLGRGYLIEVKMSTLDKVDPAVRAEIYEEAAKKVKELLPVYFPGRELSIGREGSLFKIQGDFSLGEM